MKLDPIDELIALAHGKVRSLDCIITLKVEKSLGQEDIKKRAELAQKAFPKTSAHPILITFSKSLEEFINTPLPSSFHLELGLYTEGTEAFLALKMSHLLGDAISMILWLKAFFLEENNFHLLKLSQFPAKKDTRFRKLRTCQVWPLTKHHQTDERKIIKRRFEHKNFNSIHEVNNLLTLSLLDSLPNLRRGLWIPVNVRQNFWEGFGNGLSRMRLYPPQGQNLKDKLLNLKLQKKEARKSGEISLPEEDLNLNSIFKRMLIKAWIKRPWADWGSISLSHLSDRNGVFHKVRPIYGISNIMPAHFAAIFAITYADETFITCTYDAGTISKDKVEKLLDQFEQNFKAVLHDFNS